VLPVFKNLRRRLGLGGSSVDHAKTKNERQQGDEMRPLVSREPVLRRDVFIDEGRPRR
jgi:hypothetical protein